MEIAVENKRRNRERSCCNELGNTRAETNGILYALDFRLLALIYKCQGRETNQTLAWLAGSGNLHKRGAQDNQVVNSTPREGFHFAGHIFLTLQCVLGAR